MEKNGNCLLDKKKNAFTLIELLAVIIILAVVALIATPVILNVVDNTRKKAFEQSAHGYYNDARYIYDEMLLNGNTQDITFTFENGEQSSSNANYQLQVKGEVPKNGIIHLSSNGEVLVSINNDKWCAQTEGNEVRISEDTTNCGYTVIPEECWEIRKESLWNGDGTLDGSEEWMTEEHNLLYYDTSNSNCPTEIDTLKIPSEINGEKVEGIANWTLTEMFITNVIIPSNVEYIDDGSFWKSAIKNIILSNNLKYVGLEAFGENNIAHLSFPQSLSYIGEAAFYNNQLSDDQAFIYKRNSDGTEDKTTIISYGGEKRENVVIPDSVTTIGNSAFFGNQLTSVTIPNSVTNIATYVFAQNRLTSIKIPESITSIGAQAFYDNQLTSVTIPRSVTTIGDQAFSDNNFPNANAITIEGDSTRFDSNWTNIGFPKKQ